MTKRFTFPLIASLVLLFVGVTSCEDEDNVHLLGNWRRSSFDFPGVPRGGAVVFTIDNVAYIGTGANTEKTEEKERFNDFYSVSVSEDKKSLSWSPKWDRTAEGVTSLPEAALKRNGGVGFSINGKGYVGLGFSGHHFLRDFWEFDPNGTPDPDDYPSMVDSLKGKFTNTGSWKRIADYPGDSCRYAVSFVIDNVAYVGTGEDYDNNILKDFYKFDGKTWTPIASIGIARSQATAFVITDPKDGQKYGYVFGGNNSGATEFFERYNPRTNSWETLRKTADKDRGNYDDDYVGLSSYGAVSFVLGDKAYVTTGGIGGIGNYTWEYDPAGDYWIQKTSFEGKERMFAVSFVMSMLNERTGEMQDIPFVTTGSTVAPNVTVSGGKFFVDSWYFNPYQGYDWRD
ncbi:MAG: hypothetical protein MJZ01_06495 [Bacteroidales bacterium]|nr:hypothetical protein [Bacteroidales bacterium]